MIRSTWTVARRELRSYFDHPTAYVLAVAFLAVSLFLTFRSVYAQGVASMRPLFDLLPILFAVFVPAATMRSLAEERRGRTLDWLLAQPVNETQVVLGKFIGDWIFVLIVLAGTLPTAVGILFASDADPGIVVAEYVGAALLAGQLVALGLWASSVTRNQITAFITAAVISFVLFLMGHPVVQIGLPPLLSGMVARLSVLSHFQNVARGVVDLRDVLYFVSTGALFLVLAVAAVSRERLSRLGADYRRLRLGAVVTAALVVAVNLLGSHVRGRLDLTRDHLYTLASGTRTMLGNLDDLVQVKLFASSELPPEVQLQLRDVRDLLSDMQRASDGKLVVTEENPDKNEDAKEEASSFGISPIEFNVLRNDEFQVKRGYYGLALVYADKHEVMPVIQSTDDLEYRLASSIAGMTETHKRSVAFASGFGAMSPYSIPGLSQSLSDRFQIRTVSLEGDSVPPIERDSTEVLVVAAPKQPLDSAAVRRIREYVDGGGSALLLLEPVDIDGQSMQSMPVRSGLEDFLSQHGITVSGDLVYDLSSSQNVSLGRRGLFNVVAPYPLWPIVVPSRKSPITQGLSSMTLAWAGPLVVKDTAHVTPLLQTTESGGVEPAGSSIAPNQDWANKADDDLGVRTVAVAVDPGPDATSGRMVVVDDGTFLEGQFVQSDQQNLVFVANAIDWLAQDESLIRIRSKDRTPPALVFESDLGQSMLKWGNLVGVPLLFVLVGLLWVSGRRRRAEARWKEVVA
jgi:ABC-2 type transport system permease protein